MGSVSLGKIWNVVDHLDSEAAVLAYLEAVFEDGDRALIAAALNNFARAHGLRQEPDLSPRADIGAVIRTMKALGLELTAKAA